ncbi:hypothetical protein ACJMK2_030424, partial [Sinanodonta woodiana]
MSINTQTLTTRRSFPDPCVIHMDYRKLADVPLISSILPKNKAKITNRSRKHLSNLLNIPYSVGVNCPKANNIGPGLNLSTEKALQVTGCGKQRNKAE